jgi:Flp pilus assembly protein TadD
MALGRSMRWGAVAVAAVAGAIALALFIGHWQVTSLDEQGRALVAEGQYLPAIRVLVQAVVQSPGDARAHYYLGLAYAGLGLCGAAWTHLDEATRLAPAYRRQPEVLGPACRGL